MKEIRMMSYRELEDEVSRNHDEMRTATEERKRALVRRDHELMTEMDKRWNRCEARRKAKG